MDGAHTVINVNSIMRRSRVNGPSARCVLWVQGCQKTCPGCINPEMRPFVVTKLVSVEALSEIVLSTKGIEGVTFSGGEPFCQAKGLSALGTILKRAGLSIVTYTGYTHEEIQSSACQAWKDLLSATDLLIDGPFIRAMAGDYLWRGSANQRLHFLTPRLREFKEPERLFEISLSKDGRLNVTGFPSKGLTGRLEKELRTLGIAMKGQEPSY